MKNFNNKKITEQDFNKAQQQFAKASINFDRKNEMLQSIYSSVDSTSVEAANVVEHRSPVPSPLSAYLILFQKRSLVFALAAILILSGTAYASEKSLPGDLLYKVKTDVIEPINYNLRITKESKEKYKEVIAKKRSLEAEMLTKSEMVETQIETEADAEVDATTTKPVNVAKPPVIVKTKTDMTVSGVINSNINATTSENEEKNTTTAIDETISNVSEEINETVDIEVNIKATDESDSKPKVEAKVEVKVEPEKVVDKVTDTVDKATNILGL